MIYLTVLNINILSYVFVRILNITRLQNIPGSEYIRVLNMSGFIKKMLHHIDA